MNTKYTHKYTYTYTDKLAESPSYISAALQLQLNYTDVYVVCASFTMYL